MLGAIALTLLGGLFSAIDAAITTVSTARVEELVRAERPGSVRLARVIAERPRYVNLVASPPRPCSWSRSYGTTSA